MKSEFKLKKAPAPEHLTQGIYWKELPGQQKKSVETLEELDEDSPKLNYKDAYAALSEVNPEFLKTLYGQAAELDPWDAYAALSKGTHQTMTFDFTEVNPEFLKTLYGQAAELDPWDVELEPEDELPLWEQI